MRRTILPCIPRDGVMMAKRRNKLVIFSAGGVLAALTLAAVVVYAFPSPNSTEAQTYPLRSSASGLGWNFTASINSSSVKAGQSILLLTSLTNVSPSNQTITPSVTPYINPSVYAMNGTELWAWNPMQATWPSYTVPSEQSITGNNVIPTSSLRAGQTYLIKVVPLSAQFLSPVNFALTLQFSVQ